MSRYYPNKKTTVEEAYDLTIFQLKEMRLLADDAWRCITWVNNRSGNIASVWVTVNVTDEPHIRLEYTVTRGGIETEHDFNVSLTTTLCHYGGIRYWFVCPFCSKRVGGIYRVPGGLYFACRKCQDLTYRSRNRTGIALMGHTGRQIDKLREKIKRWTWRGYPTRKVRKLHALEQKQRAISNRVLSKYARFLGNIDY